MNDTLQDLMRTATRLTRSGRLSEATEVIQRALHGSGSTDRSAPANLVDPGLVLDDCVFEAAPSAPAKVRRDEGRFTAGNHTHAALTRGYKLYAPPGHEGRSLALVVMLHGCTQDPDDFAAGTGMNERAREQGFFVLYPAQSQEANPSRCWNWFKHNHQQRGHGEPALIASLTQAVIREHGIDARRVYIAGLSAGGAMAAIVAEAYPELFAAVGVHSGLARGAASSLPEALAAMRNGAGASTRGTVPTIVFHGGEDRTVHPRNGEQLIAAVLCGDSPAEMAPPRGPVVREGVSAQGRRYTHSVHHGEQGEALAEHWLVHGAGHAWSGGRAEGSYTDVRGPDASQQMLRFFFDHPRRLQR